MKHTMIIFSFLSFFLFACNSNTAQSDNQNSEERTDKIEKSEEEWKKELTEEEFYILRKAGTERPFTSELLDLKEEGVYTCAACYLPLFTSEAKFKSGTGWPSYYEPIQSANILEHKDKSLGMVRTEVLCARCEGHLGHVFPDGPDPTGLRYCINGDAMDFVKKENP